jgi:hypothetical protein
MFLLSICNIINKYANKYNQISSQKQYF